MEGRSKLFQTLKPCCVDLSDAAIKFRSGKSSARDVSARLERLLSSLSKFAKSSDVRFIDQKICEYVFFPLSNVFRERQKLTARSIELALQCLKILLLAGWRNSLASDLAVQLIILLTFLASENTQDDHTKNTSEEARCHAFECQTAVYGSVASSRKSKTALLEAANIPALGHAVTVMLEGVNDGTSPQLQHCALGSLQEFLLCVADRELLASFLPGIVSTLTQIVTPSSKSRRPFKILQKSIEIVTDLLQSVLSNDAIASSSNQKYHDTSFIPKLDKSWIMGTSGQVRLALANIIKQRQHERLEVREALHRLCLTVLQDCSHSLVDAATMMLETLITLSQNEDALSIHDELQQVIVKRSSTVDLLGASTYNWLVSLPRVMLSNDDNAKQKMVGRLTTSIRLLGKTGVDMMTLDMALLSSLQDSLFGILDSNNGVVLSSSIEKDPIAQYTVQLVNKLGFQTITEHGFGPALTARMLEVESVELLDPLINAIAFSEGAMTIARECLDQARISKGTSRTINSWLALQIVRRQANNDIDVVEFLNITPEHNDADELREDLYAFAVSTLSMVDDGEEVDWRMQAISLETIAFNARQLKADFRLELVDVLYPVLCLMGSSRESLRQHAMVCIGIISKSCGYAHAQDLLVSNVDYLVNAIGVKLNSFDISPQAAQVLTMMTKLCGPKLLPYLDDLVDDIFEALEYFHGYPKLVEMLFAVMRTIVEEGVKSPILAIEDVKTPDHKIEPLQRKSLDDVLISLRKTKQAHDASTSEQIGLHARDAQPAPHTAWAELPNPHERTPKQPTATSATEDFEGSDEEEEAATETPPSSLSRTAQLLHRITLLTQHHLPSASPTLRSSLLSLLCQSLPHLATHEDTFLPAINTLWPVLIPRLNDPEPYIVASVLDVISTMVRGAGDFMRTRIEGIWPAIRRVHLRTQKASQDIASKKHSQSSVQTFSGGKGATSRLPTGNESSIIALPSNVLASIVKSPSTAPTASRTSAAALTRSETASESTSYQTAPLLTLRASLTAFLLCLTSSIHLPSALSTEILNRMLVDELKEGASTDVLTTLEARNPDAIWLVSERMRWHESMGSARRRADHWEKAKPYDIAGAPAFVSIVF